MARYSASYRRDVETERARIQRTLHTGAGTPADQANARQDLVQANRILTRLDELDQLDN